MKLALSFAATLAIVFCSPAVAETISLEELINDGLSITSDDKLFNQFEYTATGDMPSAADVNVIAFNQGGNYGITFQGDFSDTCSTSSMGASIATIRYQVTVLDSHQMISGAQISGDPSVSGDGLMQVVEMFLSDESDGPDETMSIYDISQGPGVLFVESASADFADSYATLHVQKNILAYAQTECSEASISYIHQTFSQVSAPEPSTVVILITGLALLGCFVRRNRR